MPRPNVPLGIVAVKELLREGLVRVGETSTQGFVAWSGSLEDIESHIDSVVESAEYPLLPGQLFWVHNTSAGDEKGNAKAGQS